MIGAPVFRYALAPGWASNSLWSAAQAVPSLDLCFADSKSLVCATTGQSLVTFTRASSGTYVGSDGVLRTATTNLLLRSEEFDNVAWAKLNSVTVSSNAIAAPNESITADKVIEPASSADKPIVQLVTTVANATYTASIYLKAAERPTILFHLRKNDYSTRFGGYFNTSTNLFTAETSSGGVLDSFVFNSIGNGWYRCSITGNIGANTSAVLTVYLANSSNNITYTGDGTSGIYLWGAQLEQWSTVGEYIPTTSTINSAPRFDHNPTTGESLGLLVEESRTNLLVRSEAFDDAAWTQFEASITANSVASPDGAQTADTLVENTTNNEHRVSVAFSATNATAYTASIYVKAAGRTLVRFGFTAVGFSAGSRSCFDLSNGTITASAGGSPSITPLRNGWYRLSVTNTTTSATTITAIVQPVTDSINFSYTGDGTNGIYIWGAQLEAGAFATSYIPTTTATVTRSADVASITGANFSSWYRQDEGTVFAEARTQQSSSGHVLAGVSTGSFTSSAYLSKESDNLLKAAPDAAPANLNIALQTVSTNVLLKSSLAFTAGTGSASAVMNGGMVGTDASTGIPTTVDRLAIGCAPWNIGTTLWNGTIRRLTYWPQRLPNNVLQTITQP